MIDILTRRHPNYHTAHIYWLKGYLLPRGKGDFYYEFVIQFEVILPRSLLTLV